MISRRAILAACLAAPLLADDPAQEVWEVLAAMAAALGDANAGLFLRHCDKAMPGYDDLRGAVTALVGRCEVESTIEPSANSGDGQRRTLEVDWQMHLIDRSDTHSTERRMAVKCTFEKQ